MSGLEEIAKTGAPAIVSALGMGTVFLCLIILYALMQILGKVMPRLAASREKRASTGRSASSSEYEAAAPSETGEASRAEEDGIAAAIMVALSRYRFSRMRSVVREPSGADQWKMAGRAQALRKR
jgi:sodium pump decarboxylase gamma subunit